MSLFFLLKKRVKLLKKKIQQFKCFWGGSVQVHTVLVRVHTVLVQFTQFCSIRSGFVMVRLPRSTGQDPSGSSEKNQSKTVLGPDLTTVESTTDLNPSPN